MDWECWWITVLWVSGECCIGFNDEGMSTYEAAEKGIGELPSRIIISTATTVAAFGSVRNFGLRIFGHSWILLISLPYL